MNIYHVIGFTATLSILVGLSVYSGKKAKMTAGSFTSGGDNSSFVVAGAIIGTLVGGSSTVGTAQLAFDYGFSAWWFTLGAGVGCLILAIWFVKPLRRKCEGTLTSLIALEYGNKVGLAATILSSIGIYINIIAQLIAATAVIAIVAPQIDVISAAFISALLMILYVIFGGVTSAGMVGILKTVLLYVATIGGGALAIYLFGGPIEIISNPIFEKTQYFSLIARGAGKDLGSGLSLVLGVLSTQTYAQACLSGRTDRDAIKGALIGAFLIPPIGIGGILIGMYMRDNHPELVSAKFAFTQFVIECMPPILGGVVIATLLIAVVGTGAGLALGISTIINQDIVQRSTTKFADKNKSTFVVRVLIIVVLLSACIFTSGALGDIILDFSFMSMGLRGAVLFVPLVFILFLNNVVDTKYALAAVILGPVTVLMGNFVIKTFDPLFIGILVDAIIMIIGYKKSKKSIEKI